MTSRLVVGARFRGRHRISGAGAAAVLFAALFLASGGSVAPLHVLPKLGPRGLGEAAVLPSPSRDAATSSLFLIPSSTCTSGWNGTCPHVNPAITANTSALCRQGSGYCPGGAPRDARVTLWANSSGHMVSTPPNVQVLFVVETTLFDGVYDDLAGEPGLSKCSGPCNESNAVPFFVANAGSIAQGIADRYPSSTVSFGMVDYFSTVGTDHDDGDGGEYHEDTSGFVPASQFQSGVTSTFQAIELGGGWVYGDSDFSDNILSSSSITALYGAETGVGYGWNPNDAKVIVWIGSSVPRDPGYVSDYAPTDSNSNSAGGRASATVPLLVQAEQGPRPGGGASILRVSVLEIVGALVGVAAAAAVLWVVLGARRRRKEGGAEPPVPPTWTGSASEEGPTPPVGAAAAAPPSEPSDGPSGPESAGDPTP